MVRFKSIYFTRTQNYSNFIHFSLFLTWKNRFAHLDPDEVPENLVTGPLWHN